MKKHIYIYQIILIVLVFVLYGNTLKNKYALDDNFVVHNNKQIQKGFSAIPEIFTTPYSSGKNQTYGYRPIAKTTFAIEYALFKQNPTISHFINLLLYILVILALFKFLSLLFINHQKWFIFFICIIFATHPIHTEAVASLKNREEILALLFAIYACILFIKTYLSKKYVQYFFVALLFILSLLSKLSTVTFVFVFPLILLYISDIQILKTKASSLINKLKIKDKFIAIIYFLHFFITIFFIKNYFLAITLLLIIIYFYINRKDILNIKKHYLIWVLILPYITTIILAPILNIFRYQEIKLIMYLPIIGVLYNKIVRLNIKVHKHILQLITISLAFGFLAFLIYIMPEQIIGKSDKILFNYENPLHGNATLANKIALGFSGLLYYLKLLIIPHPLGFYYGYNTIPLTSITDIKVLFSIILHIAIFVIGMIKLKEKHLLGFGLLFYIITISLFSNIPIIINGIIGERLLFTPSIGFAIVLSLFITFIFKIDSQKKLNQQKNKNVFLIITTIVIVLFGYKTIDRNQDWKDFLTLYQADITYLDKSVKAHSLLANEALFLLPQTKTKAEAEKMKKIVINHSKKAIQLYPEFTSAYNNIGTVYYGFGEYKKATYYLQKAYKLDTTDAVIAINTGRSFQKIKQLDSAIYFYKKTLQIDSTITKAYIYWAEILLTQKQSKEAFAILKQNIKINRYNADAYSALGNFYLMHKSEKQAAHYYFKALKINPNNKPLKQKLINYYKKQGNNNKLEQINKICE